MYHMLLGQCVAAAGYGGRSKAWNVRSCDTCCNVVAVGMEGHAINRGQVA
jgi:hypothetical protein